MSSLNSLIFNLSDFISIPAQVSISKTEKSRSSGACKATMFLRVYPAPSNLRTSLVVKALLMLIVATASAAILLCAYSGSVRSC